MRKSRPRANAPRVTSLFDFKVLVEPSIDEGGFVAYCLQTGSVATADDSDTAESILDEVIESEANHALETKDFANLYSSPAPPDVWFRWYKLAETKRPKVRFLTLRPKGVPAPKKPSHGVSSKVEVARFA
jgi:hypothetical protein